MKELPGVPGRNDSLSASWLNFPGGLTYAPGGYRGGNITPKVSFLCANQFYTLVFQKPFPVV